MCTCMLSLISISVPALSKPTVKTGGLFDDGDDDDDDLFGGSTAKSTVPEAKPASQTASKYVVNLDIFDSYCITC